MRYLLGLALVIGACGDDKKAVEVDADASETAIDSAEPTEVAPDVAPDTSVITLELPVAREGIAYVGPLGFTLGTLGGLPAGLDASDAIRGTPEFGSAGDYTLSGTDDLGTPVSGTLKVIVPEPIPGGGTASVAPEGSIVKEHLTVHVLDGLGLPVAGVAVRVRHGGLEYEPPREALSAADGRATFSGLGLAANETVDITTSYPGLTTTSILDTHAAHVTVVMRPTLVGHRRSSDARAWWKDDLVAVMGRMSGSAVNSFHGYCTDSVARIHDGQVDDIVPPGTLGNAPPRFTPQFVISGDRGLVFGGRDCRTGEPRSDFWSIDLATGTWTAIVDDVPQLDDPHIAAGPNGSFLVTTNPIIADERIYRLDVAPTPAWTVVSTTELPLLPGPLLWRELEGTLWSCGGDSPCEVWSSSADVWSETATVPTGLVPRLVERQADHAVFIVLRNAGVAEVHQLKGDEWQRIDTSETSILGYGPSSAAHWDTALARIVLVTGGGRPDAWTFDPETGVWQQTVGDPPPPEDGFVISGAITADFDIGDREVLVYASAASGYQNVGFVSEGHYELVGLPSQPLHISATVLSPEGGGYPSASDAFVDLGIVPAPTADGVLDVHFGATSTNRMTATVNVSAPATWPEISRVVGISYATPLGFPDANFTGADFADSPPLTMHFHVPPAPSEAIFEIDASVESDALCEVSTVRVAAPAANSTISVTMPTLGALGPGLSECDPSQAWPEAADETFTIEVPAGAKLVVLRRGALYGPIVDDLWIPVPDGATTVSGTFPLPSTLVSTPALAADQLVAWRAEVYLLDPRIDFDDVAFGALTGGVVGSAAHVFRRPSP